MLSREPSVHHGVVSFVGFPLPGLVLLEENGSSTSGSGVTIASYTGRVLASVEQSFTGPQFHCK